MQKVLVASLGGSLIMPKKMDSRFLTEFVKTLRKHYKNHKFVIVCGGGTIARKYINALRLEHKSKKELALAGILATRMNARFVMQLFGKEANDKLPENMKEVEDNLPKNNVVVCGALRYAPNSTSDGTAAKIANFIKAEFVNMTDVPGLFTDNPKTHPNAKLIPEISWKDFERKALKIKFEAGQNFVLDQQAAVLIRKHKIKTFIVGKDLRNLDNFFSGKKFVGTTIAG